MNITNNMPKGNPQLDKEIERAIHFLVHAIEDSGSTSKPVILHSIRVGLYLYELGYGKEIILGGVLHDLLEDSAIELTDLQKEFGEEVAKLVQATSFNEDLEDKKERYFQTFERCSKLGKSALVIKAADLYDNSFYHHLVEDGKLARWLLWKLNHFLTNTRSLLEGEAVWKELKERYEKMRSN